MRKICILNQISKRMKQHAEQKSFQNTDKKHKHKKNRKINQKFFKIRGTASKAKTAPKGNRPCRQKDNIQNQVNRKVERKYDERARHTIDRKENCKRSAEGVRTESDCSCGQNKGGGMHSPEHNQQQKERTSPKSFKANQNDASVAITDPI